MNNENVYNASIDQSINACIHFMSQKSLFVVPDLSTCCAKFTISFASRRVDTKLFVYFRLSYQLCYLCMLLLSEM